MPAFDPEKFVNRKKELAFVKERVSQLTTGLPFEPSERVFHFIGPRGIGKSYLLEKCCLDVSNDPHCIPILIQLEALRRRGKSFVDLLLLTVHEKFCTHKRIAVGQHDGKTRKQFVSQIHRTMNSYGKDQVIALFLDEINTLDQKETQEIEETLLEELLNANERAVLVTAGRSHPMLNKFALRPTKSNTFLLSAFDEMTTGDQLEKLKAGSARIAGKVLELGNGVPGNNTRLIEYIVSQPLDIPNRLDAVQSLLADARDDIDVRFYPIMEALCVLQAFFPEDTVPLIRNHPALGDRYDEVGIKQMFPELNQIQIGPGGLINWDKGQKTWVMDEPTRALFERELQMRDPELWRKLHCTAYKMYKHWGDQYNSQHYNDKAKYHWQRLQSAGCACDDVEVRIEQ